ncbi:carbohydrate-binding module family 1 protein [Serendipita vermifera MAFF 305830]|uniref:AA9 family lytic polysaccharide monooxygenase n=1 Tax=Serendipita vermifera MAFF 305830 TaxID=933852 RepID=A0A0C3AR85_SERVB|nr:carbohydrate-binding module family 1 protein [Serendipita vermifera MAFF 305830]
MRTPSSRQRVSVNGADQGLLVGMRAPSSNNPIQNVNDGNIACNSGLSSSSTIINVPAGARVGALWQHVIGGPQGSNDADNPIAKSHHGPIQVYLAKVSNAASTGTSGLSWFKIASDGLSGGQWGVDRMVANNGWAYFTMPSCIAPGNYLMRVELLALHSAGSQGGAQFFYPSDSAGHALNKNEQMSCAQINVTGSGNFSPSSTVKFPGVYSATDPGILISIYGSSGAADNGGRAYNPPGPAVITCSGGGNTNPTTTTAGSGGGGGTAALYAQCGGKNYSGPTVCASGTCKVSNEFYSQCLP